MKSFLALSGGEIEGVLEHSNELHEMKGEMEIRWDECGISAGALTAGMVAQTTPATFTKMIKTLKQYFSACFHVVGVRIWWSNNKHAGCIDVAIVYSKYCSTINRSRI